jgi:hypothetical protein
VAGRTLQVRPSAAADGALLRELFEDALGRAELTDTGLITGPLTQDAQLNSLLNRIAAKQIALAEITTTTASLDEVFLQLTTTSGDAV